MTYVLRRALLTSLGSFATSTIAAAHDVTLGVLLIGASWWILAARTAQVPVSGFQLLCGVWLIIGPFVLQYRGLSQATLNDLIVGAIVVTISAFEMWTLARAPIKAM
jgi:SPW repeat-containing protein